MLDLKEEEAVAVPEQIIYCAILHQVTPYKNIKKSWGISLAGRGPAVDIVHGYKHFEGHSYALNHDFYNT